jgi:hypothetical protein
MRGWSDGYSVGQRGDYDYANTNLPALGGVGTPPGDQADAFGFILARYVCQVRMLGGCVWIESATLRPASLFLCALLLNLSLSAVGGVLRDGSKHECRQRQRAGVAGSLGRGHIKVSQPQSAIG